VKRLSSPSFCLTNEWSRQEYITQPFATWAELEKTHHFVSSYAPELPSASYEEARSRVQEMAATQSEEDGIAASACGVPHHGKILIVL
jgi:hypothetical protein